MTDVNGLVRNVTENAETDDMMREAVISSAFTVHDLIEKIKDDYKK